MSLRINNKLSTKEGLEELDLILAKQSFIGGHQQPNSTDCDVLEALGSYDFSSYKNIKRWNKYITSFTKDERKGWNAGFIAIEGFEKKEEPEENLEDDLFGEITAEEQAQIDEKKKKEEEEKKNKPKEKPKVIAKSSILIDVKPLDDEVNMETLENAVRSIKLPSLKWNASKFIDVAYGIKKLQILCTIEDDKVTGDDLEEKILAIDTMVQSYDIVSWNKCG